jgi:thiol-disulfide isomerase/thioredoxin
VSRLHLLAHHAGVPGVAPPARRRAGVPAVVPRARARAVPAARARGLRRAGATIGATAALAVAALAIAGCDSGSIGADVPQSSGTSFVGSSYTSTLFKAGQRPQAPEVSGTSLTGQRLRLSAYRGDIVVLNFWGSWCTPCRAEAPSLGTLSRQLYGSGVRFVGVDIRDEPDSALAFMHTFRVGYPSFNDPNDEIALDFRGTVTPAAIPTTLVIDRSGQIAARIVGGVTYAGLKSVIFSVAGRAT